MSAPVYFETSVFLAILGGDKTSAPAIKELLRELKREKVKIYTSIITVQEVSVRSFSRGSLVTDNHTKVGKLARIAAISKEIALTAAKYEASIIEAAKKSGDTEENKRRKWDCFHLATAVALNCNEFYTFDKQYGAQQRRLSLSHLYLRTPSTKTPSLLPDLDLPSLRTGRPQ